MIKEKYPLHNLFVKVSEELDFVPAIKPVNSYPAGNQTTPCIIVANSGPPPIIMLLGDHGFREGVKKEEHKYAFMNLNAIYLPEKNYGGFYDSISNVNQFRVLLNIEFEQHLSLLKDSTIFLWGD